jgi:anti-sigma28 factor (negative regulator of flagellin synthesis)
MKIHNTNSENVSGLRNVETEAPRGTTRGAPAEAGKNDQVQISSLGTQMSGLDAQASQTARLTMLSRSISAGTYHVDAGMLSNKLIQEHMRSAA